MSWEVLNRVAGPIAYVLGGAEPSRRPGRRCPRRSQTRSLLKESSMRVVVRLEIAEGGLVGTFAVPSFERLPEVIGWGARVFVLHEPADGRLCPGVAPVYREGLVYVIPPGQE